MSSKKYDFDYIIIGGGPAGSTAALNLAKKTKKRIALVEDYSIGGSDSERDVPYLFNLGFVHSFYKLQNLPEFSQQSLHYNLPTLVSRQIETANNIAAERQKTLETASVTLIGGHAYFVDSHTISVNDKQLTSEIFILATGSRLKTGNIAGLDVVDYFAPESIVKLRRLPKNALVIGGGSTGCEIASYLSELGVKVVLIEKEAHLLPKEDPDVAEHLTEYFTKELGILVATNSEVVALESTVQGKRVIFSTNHQEKAAHIECIILATGSAPVLDYGLENAGVKYKDTGITANRLFQTSAKNIYAIGDCLGNEHSSTERAEYQAGLLVTNLAAKVKNFAQYNGFIRRVNTYPSIAIVGKTEAKLKKDKYKYATSTVYLKNLPAGKIDDLNYGFVKVIADHTGRILGGAIFAPHAELAATELSLALRNRLTTTDLASAPHVANNYNIAIKLAARALLKK